MKCHRAEQCVGTFAQREGRSRWRTARARRATAVVVVLVAGVLAAAAASASLASAAVIVSYSAKSGELRGGRLIMGGVTGRARYVTDAGRSRTMSLGRLHRRVFLPGKPPTGKPG